MSEALFFIQKKHLISISLSGVFVEMEGFEPSSEHGNCRAFYMFRLCLLSGKSRTQSFLNLPVFTRILNQGQRPNLIRLCVVDAPNSLAAEVSLGGTWLMLIYSEIKQPWHTKYCQLLFERIFNRRFSQLPTCLYSQPHHAVKTGHPQYIQYAASFKHKTKYLKPRAYYLKLLTHKFLQKHLLNARRSWQPNGLQCGVVRSYEPILHL